MERPLTFDELLLGESTLFRGVGLEAVRALLEAGHRRELKTGELLLDPAQPNEQLFVVLEGTLRVHLGARDTPAVRTGGRGEVFGELSLIDGDAPSAWVVAGEPSRVFCLPGDLVWSLVESSHGVARNLLRILTGRVRDSNAAILTGRERELAIEHAAKVDALTGLHNRRWLDEMFERQVRRCVWSARPVTLFMVDIDRFKLVNDQYGHPAGDAVLRLVAHALRASLRPTDLIARYGGEEFAALLPETAVTDACRVAERVRTAVERLAVRLPDGRVLPGVTISIGVAGWREGRTHEDMVLSADAALLQAKADGRNRWVLAPGESDAVSRPPAEQAQRADPARKA